MKFLALEHETPGADSQAFEPHLKAEALKVWELYQAGVIREVYFRQDRSEAVLVLECESVDEAKEFLNTMPLVQAELISFEIIPLIPYPGFARLMGMSEI